MFKYGGQQWSPSSQRLGIELGCSSSSPMGLQERPVRATAGGLPAHFSCSRQPLAETRVCCLVRQGWKCR